MDLQAYTQNRLNFLSGVYLEYTKENTFKILWWMMMY